MLKLTRTNSLSCQLRHGGREQMPSACAISVNAASVMGTYPHGHQSGHGAP